MNVIGTCSLCGGAVCTPELWGGVLPPQPTCNRCGAVAANHGPIIPMKELEGSGRAWSNIEETIKYGKAMFGGRA